MAAPYAVARELTRLGVPARMVQGRGGAIFIGTADGDAVWPPNDAGPWTWGPHFEYECPDGTAAEVAAAVAASKEGSS